MTISIGGIALSEDLVWLNEFDYPAISQSVRPLLGGGVIVQQTNNTLAGREVQLVARGAGGTFDGYFTRLQVQQIKALEAAGSQVTFVYNATTLNVIIKSNGVDVTPALPRPDQEATDWYSGTITMIEV